MNPSRRRGIVGAVVGALGIAAGVLVALQRQRSTGSAATEQSEIALAALLAASFPDESGRERRVSEWNGRIRVVNFWASWCAPCRDEIPIFNELRREFDTKIVEFMGIAIDSAANVAEFTATVPIDYPVLVAGPAGVEILRGLGNRAGVLPYTVILDAADRVIDRRAGDHKKIDLQALLRSSSSGR